MRASGIVTPRRTCGPSGNPVARETEKISYAGYRFPPETIDQAIWLYLRFTLSLCDVEDLLAERGVAVSYETVRRSVNHFGPMVAADLRKRRLKPYTTWHLDEVYLKIDGQMVYLWRAVDAEGEVLDVPTTCGHTAPQSGSLGSNATMNAGDGRTTEQRIRISRRGGGSARCNGSRALAPRRNSCQRTRPSTISSTSNVISHRPKRTARFALWRWTHGGLPSQQPENS
jgi:hypothetical protein